MLKLTAKITPEKITEIFCLNDRIVSRYSYRNSMQNTFLLFCPRNARKLSFIKHYKQVEVNNSI